MAKKDKNILEEAPIIEDIRIEPMEEVMGTRYATYAKYVIQDRAIPDARDGLKPVQRRILYSMYKNGLFYSRPTKKCATVVGDVMGHYHPHGDSSIYEAIVRMSQDWKVNAALIDFQGNNGSIDGDSAAAYRYTECRLSAIAEEMIRDLDKETVDRSLTFDDTDFEPVVLPAHFPNLLVNGTEGIAVALATDIPTHNLCEVIDAVIYRISHPNSSIEDLMQFVKGPDFPTGGYIYDGPGLKEIYETGRGRIEVCSKTEIVQNNGITQIIISEIPYRTVKIDLVHELDMLRVNHTINGIVEVRDESDRAGLRIAIDLKKDANVDVIHKYLITKTGLRTSYSANMVAIVNGRPHTMNLIDFIDNYLNHQVDVITRQSNYDLRKCESRLNIVNGLIKAISILDQVVDLIRSSRDKKDAKENLERTLGFDEQQSEAIVMLQLYKLSNTDVTVLKEEKASLEQNIEFLDGVLNDRSKLNKVLIADLKSVSKKYGKKRKTQIIEKVISSNIIDKRDLITKEETMVAITRDGYFKRSTVKSYRSSGDHAMPGIKEGDVLAYLGKAFTTDYMICFTNLGNYLFVPVHEIVENKWKDEGKHINYLLSLNPNEKIIKCFAVQEFKNDLFITLVSKQGQIKKTRLNEFFVSRYNRPITCMKLLKTDEVKEVLMTRGLDNLYLFSSSGRANAYSESEITESGLRSSGIKAFGNLQGALIAGMVNLPKNENNSKVILLTAQGCQRIFDLSYLAIGKRLGKSFELYRTFQKEPHELIYVHKADSSESITFRTLLSSKEIFEFEITDFHLTPLDKYAKTNLDLKKKDLIECIYDDFGDYISKDIIGDDVPLKEVAPRNYAKNVETFEESETDEEYTQLSIFDNEDNND